MIRTFLLFATTLGGLAVILGAFGAHGLEDSITPKRMSVWKTAARYHLIHSTVLLAVCGLLAHFPSKILERAAWCFIIGIIIFASTLYLLVLTDTPFLGAITPLGGLFLIIGWAHCVWFAAVDLKAPN